MKWLLLARGKFVVRAIIFVVCEEDGVTCVRVYVELFPRLVLLVPSLGCEK